MIGKKKKKLLIRPLSLHTHLLSHFHHRFSIVESSKRSYVFQCFRHDTNKFHRRKGEMSRSLSNVNSQSYRYAYLEVDRVSLASDWASRRIRTSEMYRHCEFSNSKCLKKRKQRERDEPKVNSPESFPVAPLPSPSCKILASSSSGPPLRRCRCPVFAISMLFENSGEERGK
jgi:hypothetical protein